MPNNKTPRVEQVIAEIRAHYPHAREDLLFEALMPYTTDPHKAMLYVNVLVTYENQLKIPWNIFVEHRFNPTQHLQINPKMPDDGDLNSIVVFLKLAHEDHNVEQIAQIETALANLLMRRDNQMRFFGTKVMILKGGGVRVYGTLEYRLDSGLFSETLSRVDNVVNLFDHKAAKQRRGADVSHHTEDIVSVLDITLPPATKAFVDTNQASTSKLTKTTNGLIFYGPDNKIYLEIDFDTDSPTVNLHGHAPDAAAKIFWNEVTKLIHRPPLFPEMDKPPDPK